MRRLRRDDVDAVPVALFAAGAAARNIDQWLAFAEIVFGVERTPRAPRLLWGDAREAGTSGLHRLLITRSRQWRFVKSPHAAVGARIVFDVADAGARHL